MRSTSINGRWDLILPDHRADRPEWPWWEAQRLAAMHHVIQPGDVVYDIGAEEGDFPALWASWGATVHLFEPNPKVWPNIRAIFEANDLEMNGWYVGFAGSHTNDIEQPPAEAGWPLCAYGELIGDHGFCQLGERPDIACTTLNDYGGTPDVITIDVEGAELSVLEGATEILAQHPVVFVSIHPDFMREHYQREPSDLHAFMGFWGYEGRFLCTDHEQHWVFQHPLKQRMAT